MILPWLRRITIWSGLTGSRPAGSAGEKRVDTSRSGEFAKLYDEYMPKVYRYVFYRLRNQQRAEDVTSEIFEKAVTRYHDYDSRRASFSTWIFTIAHNAVVDSYKTDKESRQTPLDAAAELVSREPGPEEALESLEEKKRLVDCVGGLPAREQEIIRLKFGARLNNRQIGSLMGLSESNVGTILGRSIGKLRLSLRENANE